MRVSHALHASMIDVETLGLAFGDMIPTGGKGLRGITPVRRSLDAPFSLRLAHDAHPGILNYIDGTWLSAPKTGREAFQ